MKHTAVNSQNTSVVERCDKCGHSLQPNKLVRFCGKCQKPIVRHEKYVTVQVSKNPPRYEFHHRNCKDTESYK